MKKVYAFCIAFISAFFPGVSFAGGDGANSCNIQLVTGWNLAGSTAGTASVAALFSDKTKVNTVWKWNTVKNNWAFYAPNSDGGVAYATSKGYELLTSINGGEGFWVNALLPFTFNICADSSMRPVVLPTVPLETIISIFAAAGVVEIIPAIVDGKITNLAGSNPAEQVLDTDNQIIPGYRIAWNDNGDWYPASGKVTSLLLPKTALVGAARSVGTGAGMPYLVRPDGTFVPFNTGHAIVLVDGNNMTTTTIATDGLIHY